MLIPPMMPPTFVPLPHTGGPPAAPRKWEPPCARCVDLVTALQVRQHGGGIAGVRREIVAHFDADHAEQ